MANIKYDYKIKLLSPLSHNSDENFGTDVQLRTYKVKYGNDFEDIPFISGNSIRGILRRRIIKDFIDQLGIKALAEQTYFQLFSGGILEKGSYNIEIAKQKEIRENIPPISLLGTAFSNFIMSGKMKVGIGILISKETNKFTGENSQDSYVNFIDEVFYTRKDDREDKENDITIQMKYSGQILIPGAELKTFFIIENATEIEASCFARMIKLMKDQPFLCGKSSIGHGKVEYISLDLAESEEEYMKHLTENKEEIVEFVSNLDKKV